MVPEKYKNRKTPEKVSVEGFGDIFLRSLSVEEWVEAVEAINAFSSGKERIKAISRALVAPSLVSEWMIREIIDCTTEEAGKIDQTLVASLFPHLCRINKIEFGGGKPPSLENHPTGEETPEPDEKDMGELGITEKNSESAPSGG